MLDNFTGYFDLPPLDPKEIVVMRECRADVWAETAADLESTTVMDFSNNSEFYGSFKSEWDGKTLNLNLMIPLRK